MQHGNVQRILGQLSNSREALVKAESELSRGSLRPELQAFLWELRGSLYRDWREFANAEDCLTISCDYHSKAGQLDDSNRCLVCCAICAGKGDDPTRAVRLAEEATRRIDSKARPDLAVSAIHALCWNLVDVGKPVLALATYTEGEPLFETQADELVQVHRSWLRAHIDHALGHHQAAEAHYRRAARGFARQDLAYERALVLLDLCLPLAAQDRLDELAAVAADILPEFERIGIGREAAASRILLSAATQASIAKRLQDIEKVSRLVQQALPPAQKLPEL
jgi:tetratricopeptide (TPR) repeat protein